MCVKESCGEERNNWLRKWVITYWQDPFDWDSDENKDVYEAVVNYMYNNIRELVHMEEAPCTKQRFIEKYIEKDPEFEQLLYSEFNIYVKGGIYDKGF